MANGLADNNTHIQDHDSLMMLNTTCKPTRTNEHNTTKSYPWFKCFLLCLGMKWIWHYQQIKSRHGH